VRENAILGARAVAQSDVPAHHVAVGTPARSVRVKPGWKSVAEPVDADHDDGREDRRIPYDLPNDLETFDEFQRDRTPPE